MKAFLAKETKEIIKTYRVWVIPVIFLFIGFSAPASAKFMPEILNSQLESQNVIVKLPEPSAAQAFSQYFKNLTQIGLLAVILLSAGLIAEEKTSGVLVQVVSKPIKRSVIVVAKWLVHGCWLIFSFAFGALGCYLYTVALFGHVKVSHFLAANLIFLLYMILIFSLSVAASAALRSQIAAGGVALAGFFFLTIIGAFDQSYVRNSPAALSDLAYKAISKPIAFSEVLWPVSATLVSVATLLALGIMIFERQEI